MDTPILLLIFLIIYFTTLCVLKNMGFMKKLFQKIVLTVARNATNLWKE